VYHAEDRRVGADPKRQGNHGQRSKPRVAREQTQSEADVLNERFHGSL
jgi:hypothetical protein